LNRISLVRALNEAASSSRGRRQVGGSSHQHLALPVDLQPLEPPGVFGDGLAQLGKAHHRRILVVAVHQIVGRRGPYGIRSLVVGKALAEVDRLMLAGKCRHHLENRRSEAGHQ
jgi:hypothetical protein